MADKKTRMPLMEGGIPSVRNYVYTTGGISSYTVHKENILDTEKYQNRLLRLQQWRRQSRAAQADNRMEMAIDEDYYDGIQLDESDLKVHQERGQPPLSFNVIKNTINWLLGTERKSRIDYKIRPRTKADAASAKIKTDLHKYVSDCSNAEEERSLAFDDCSIAGLGWLEVGARSTNDEPLFIRQETWRNMWFDHLGRRNDTSDWRYLFREKWVDLDIAQEMFPERAQSLEQVANQVNSLYPFFPNDASGITDYASEYDFESEIDQLFAGDNDFKRPRVKLIEAEYRVLDNVKLMNMLDPDTPYGTLNGVIYRPKWEDHKYLVKGGYASLTDATIMATRKGIWTGSIFLQDDLTPYYHNRFSFIPMFCYRRRRDNMPYGIIRDIRDPQSDLNKRRSRSLFLLSSDRVIADKGAVDNKQEAFDEVHRPDGWVDVNPGKKFEIVNNLQIAKEHLDMARDDERFISNISGITQENKGQTERELSGKAIQSLQNQGMVSNSLLFNNYFFNFKQAGEVVLSLTEQFYDAQKEVAITGANYEEIFMDINKVSEDGQIENNITKSKARFTVSRQDYRETMRLAMFQMLSELVNNLASSMPEVALALLDVVVDFMDDLPNKEEVLQRIRKINKQHAPESEMTPEEKQQFQAAEQKEAQKQQMLEALQFGMAQAKLAVERANATTKETKAMKDQVEAQMKKLEGFLKALEVAGVVSAAPRLVHAADALIQESQTAISGGNGKDKTAQEDPRQLTR